MRIKRIELKNFKRFSDLTISQIPQNAKLVLLIGSNGSGKSSLFDAFNWLRIERCRKTTLGGTYYKKNKNEPRAKIELHDGAIIKKEGDYLFKNDNSRGAIAANNFFGRSSIRIVPEITEIGSSSKINGGYDGPLSYIHHDTRFINDVTAYIEKIIQELTEPVFRGESADALQIFQKYIKPLNDSLLKIFGEDKKTTIQIAEYYGAKQNEPAKLIFKKGDSKINYDLLSHGEKQIVILLINFIVRQDYYKNSIIFIDEMDCHLNTAIQYRLLEEIVSRWIPDDSQLWTASHSLGFIDYAKDSQNSSIIDFGLLNFDFAQELKPLNKERSDIYEVALPKATIIKILKGHKLVIAENSDSKYFNISLGEEGFLFLPANNNREVFLTTKSDKSYFGLRDRDYLRGDEIEQIQKHIPNLKILKFSTFENYIYHPQNLEEIGLVDFSKEDYLAELIRQKNEKLLEIVGEIAISRQSYIEFKDCIKNYGNIDLISQKLQSDELEDFYQFFNMKKHFNKTYLQKFNLKTENLVQTEWFKAQIKNILK